MNDFQCLFTKNYLNLDSIKANRNILPKSIDECHNMLPDYQESEYKFLYKDIAHLDEISCIAHYFFIGRKDNRACSLNVLKEQHDINYEIMKKENEQICKKYIFREKKINILTRTSNREKSFNICMSSIKNQTFKNYNIICCFDNEKDRDYVSKHTSNHFYVKNSSNNDHHYNLYLNELKSYVSDGWIIFLDDDDHFTSNFCLSFINNNLKDEDTVYVWKYLRPDKLIFPKENKVNLGEIPMCSFCFHSKHKNKTNFDDKEAADYRFFKDLDLKIKFLNFTLTKSIFDEYLKGYGDNQ
jgi:hypothetical protein